MTHLRALILGAAAGGGLPQWNCGCQNCNAARDGSIPAASQSSVAFSANGTDWAILNASPDIRYQIAAAPPLHPTGPRDSPIRSVVLTNGDIDHVVGLLTLREKQAFHLFTTAAIADVLDENPIFRALDPKFVTRQIVGIGETFEIAPDLLAEMFVVPGKVPLYMEGDTVDIELEGEQTVGVVLQADGKQAFYLPGCAKVTSALSDRMRGAELVFFDGTVWENEEMIRMGVGAKTGARMGHMSMAGDAGSMAAFEALDVSRKIFVHMNNTNPVLDPSSPERAKVEASGWEVAFDGMEVSL